jgi:cyclopropane-fatty-acyl-phospholipid synthase
MFSVRQGLASAARHTLERLLAPADVAVGGERPWDLVVHDDRFYERVLAQGALGFGESYMEGWWDCAAIDELVARLLRSAVDDTVVDWRTRVLLAEAKLRNLQTTARARQVALAHYDLGNELFLHMLGPTMNYSCGYWREASDLDAAQTAKMELTCKKLGLVAGERLLDIGCGWGGLLRFAAERYGCEVVGITVSEPQAAFARAATRELPVRILTLDYRAPELRRHGPFDKIVSIGMFEHVGRKNYATFMDAARRLLKDDGLFLLHTIGNDHSSTDAWVNRHLFPNGMLPASADLGQAIHGRFVLEDWHSFGADYDKTLMAWHANFERYAATPAFTESRTFYRMWRYYLLSFAGCFRSRTRNQLWQLVLSKRGVPGGYRSLR